MFLTDEDLKKKLAESEKEINRLHAEARKQVRAKTSNFGLISQNDKQ